MIRRSRVPTVELSEAVPSHYALGAGNPADEFLWLILPMTASAVGLTFWLLRRVTPAAVEPPSRQLTVYEIALLYGEERAVLAAVTLLRAKALIGSDGLPLRRCSVEEHAQFDPLTGAVFNYLHMPGQTIGTLTSMVHGRLTQLQEVLTQRGYLADGRAQRKARRALIPLWVATLLGTVMVVAAHPDDGVYHNLYPLVPILSLYGTRFMSRRLRVTLTSLGTAARQRATRELCHLRPQQQRWSEGSEPYEQYGPEGAAMAAAVFGVPALRTLDRRLAAQVKASNSASRSDGQGGDGGDGGE
ncbi:TIGR04222 domain-containing membrane protein [Nocardia carnea]|uniref:TIGR04222 domain-containing membrane protein n=1 Tax=Nocardia carnea TaxID=37328 RepID=UPI002457D3B0|nr:TIGR04222 domain-containing membrane protein [Nocardia carnea]